MGIFDSLLILSKPNVDSELFLLDQTTDEAEALSTSVATPKFPCLSLKSGNSDGRDCLSLETLSDKSLFWFPKSSSWASKILACLKISSASSISPLRLNASAFLFNTKSSL
ncbi:hypothetical protein V8G54_004198 [Vigna mungo]|uniref:Uncharacterized protein n=1 Tax=Vigna mungo TaxID=3915 RepID=A0AAQ3SF94_VIGMU